MIDLAPKHKITLPIKHPLMPASGFFGYGWSAYAPIIQADLFGAMVTNPISLRPQRHQAPPEAIETKGGVVLNTLPSNPGVKKVIRQHKRGWRRASIPIIAHLPADDPPDLARTVGALDGLELIAGFELGIPRDSTPGDVKALVSAILQRSELPLLVKLPFSPPSPLAEAAISAGAAGLVMSSPPIAAAYDSNQVYIGGFYYGSGIAPQLLPHIIETRTNFPDISIIAGGGVHSQNDVEAYLQAGANAVQIDSLLFIDPAQVQQLLLNFQGVSND